MCPDTIRYFIYKYRPIPIRYDTNYDVIKVVKRLSVSRLPVKLPVTGFTFNFQLPTTDLTTSSTATRGRGF